MEAPQTIDLGTTRGPRSDRRATLVLDDGPFTLAPERLAHARVGQTWAKGNLVAASAT